MIVYSNAVDLRGFILSLTASIHRTKERLIGLTEGACLVVEVDKNVANNVNVYIYMQVKLRMSTI